MTTNEYKWQPITETIEMGANEFTVALAQSMMHSKENILRKLLDEALPMPLYNHEIKVNFDGKE